MGKIVAIGGGESGYCGTPYETGVFDKRIVELTEKSKPNFLFIGFANRNPDSYFEAMGGAFRDRYGCQTDHLTTADIKNYELAEMKIKNADIIYVGGGNTYKLMTLFRMFGIDKMLVRAYDEGKVMCGVSAGAICWCSYGNSNSRVLSSGASQLIRVSGLGFLNIMFCPHYGTEKKREESLKNMMKRTYKIPAFALDKAALEFVDGKVRVLRLDESAIAKKLYWKNGRYIEEDILGDGYYDAEELFQKS